MVKNGCGIMDADLIHRIRKAQKQKQTDTTSGIIIVSMFVGKNR